MIINTLSSNPSLALELGRRIAATEQRRREPRVGLSAVWHRLFARQPAAKLVREHA